MKELITAPVGHGPKGSLKVLVIELPVITEVKGILLQQSVKGEDKRELLLLCNTANRHPLEYAWIKDGETLTRGTDRVNVSLEENTAVGEYECHVSNLAGSAKKSLVLSPVVQTG
ncbi:hypothetical protein OS493_037478 [Desmophyllum pertusum]|uniref:Ig-like domain-containing protein n=1 Tax=Desmophyllum pertusum TaxID=174260 RepID=A0A9W9Z6S4_9CNID|nr:hypothetical protein OS493_037478 [Desmophyllum pertusum]